MSGRPQHRARRTRRGVGARPLLFAVGFLLASAAPALAFYVIDVTYTSNDGIAQANQLVAPSSPTASADNTSGTITVRWTAAASGVDPQYQVVRVSGPGSPTTVCTVPSDVTSCQDTGLTAGTAYDYSIRALLDDWQSAPVTVTATTASPTLAIALSTSTAGAGTPVNVQTITAEVAGVPDPTYTGNKTITWSGLTNSPSGVAPSYPSTSVMFTNGVATPTGSTLTDDQAGSDTLTATDADATTVTGSVGFTISPLGATSFAVATPSSPSAGVAFDETITALDAYGNTATAYTGDQTVTFAGPSSSPDQTAPTYPATVAFAAGVGTGPITLFDAQSTELIATQGTTTGGSGSFTVGAGAAGQLAFIAEPTSSSSGTVWGVQPTVAVEDAFGNTVSSSSAPVELTIDAPPAGSGTLTCSTDPEEASAGVAGFTQCEITTTTSGDYTLSATSGGLDSATSGEIEITS
jgi:trimeric autotransporter adhesin